MSDKRNIIIYLEDILESAELVESYLTNFSEGEFYQSTEKQDAILRRIQIIGEAAKHIPDQNRVQWNHVPWREIAGMRDIIVHEYFGITLGMVWRVAVDDLPVLKAQIKQILDEISEK